MRLYVKGINNGTDIDFLLVLQANTGNTSTHEKYDLKGFALHSSMATHCVILPMR